MTEREALLRAVCENPDDDTPRLVFADWLQEYGDESDQARAEFIRVQVLMEQVKGNAEENWPSWQCLCGRETALRVAYDEKWWAELPDAPGYRLGRLFTRGFIPWAVVTEWEAFVRDLDVILGTSPVVSVSVRCELDITQPEKMNILTRFRHLDLEYPSRQFAETEWLALLDASLPKLSSLVLARLDEGLQQLIERLDERFGEKLHFPPKYPGL